MKSDQKESKLSVELLESRLLLATITVTTLVDNTTVDGQVTLREAIQAANTDASVDGSTAGSGADEIVFDAALFGGGPGTISMNGTALPTITDDLTITGPGEALLTIDANMSSRILRVDDSNPGPNMDVAISGVTLTGGRSASDGGAIYNTENLTLTDSTLTDNWANGSSTDGGAIYSRLGSSAPSPMVTVTDCTFNSNGATGDGGAIYNQFGTTTVTGTTFDSNQADAGGAIYQYYGTASVSGSTFTGNHAPYGGGIFNNNGALTLSNTSFTGNYTTSGDGGGVFNMSSASGATVTSCTFTGNTAATDGGGMYNYNSPLTMTGGTFDGNSAGNVGGGLYHGFDTANVSGTTFTNNSAAAGGGIYNEGGGLTLTGATFDGNSATSGDGGGLFNYSASSTVVMTSCTFTDNTAAQSGGGMRNIWSSVSVSGSTFTDNQASYGGGIYSEATVLSLTGTTFTGNDATSGGGGGIYNLSCSSGVYVTSCTFTSNTAMGNGGGIYSYSGSLSLYNTTLSGNFANGSGSYGGGLYMSYATGTVTGTTFDGNGANTYGGGVYLNAGTLNVSGSSVFSGNQAGWGGGIHNEGGTLSVTDTAFTANTASGGDGGGIYNISSGSGVSVTSCTFATNTATGNGGGIFSYSTATDVSDSQFTGNSATYGGALWSQYGSLDVARTSFAGNAATSGDGGGAYIDNTSSVWTNCLFTGNTASSWGGGMFAGGIAPDIVNVTFAGNQANNGGGLANSYCNAAVTNSIFWGNSATSNGDQVYNFSSSPTFSYCDIQDSGGSGGWDAMVGTDGGNNIDADPLFADADGADNVVGTLDDNLRLQMGSPAINTADGGAAPADDLDGAARPQLGGFDMGAYELNSLSGAGGQVILFDTDATGPGDWDVSMSDVRILYDINGSVRAVYIIGNPTGFGMIVNPIGENTVYIGDSRRGALNDFSFIACMNDTRGVVLKSTVTGVDLNGATMGGVPFPGDVDGDGMTDDLTGLYVEGNLGRATLRAGSSSDVVVGGNVTSYIYSRGDMLGDVAVDGNAQAIRLYNGTYAGDITVGGDAARIELRNAQALITGDVDVRGVLGYLYVNGNDWQGDLHAFSMGTVLYNTPNGLLPGQMISTNPAPMGGPINRLTVQGPIAGTVRSATDLNYLYARGGVSATGQVLVGTMGPGHAKSMQILGGLAGDLTVSNGVDYLYVRGQLSGNVTVQNGDLTRMNVSNPRALAFQGGSLDVQNGNVTTLYVSGAMQNSAVDVSGSLKYFNVLGNLVGSSVNADTLFRVTVSGQIVGPGEEIHAQDGMSQFYIRDHDQLALVSAANNHVLFDGLDAWVGTGMVD